MPRFQHAAQPDWDWWGKLWPTPEDTLRELGVESGKSVLEIGSGNGYFTLPAARIVDPAPIYAVELEASLLEELEDITAKQRIDNVVSIHCTARSCVDELDESISTCLLANVLHGIEDPEPVLSTVEDALGDEGRLIAVNWQPLERETTTVDGEPRGPPTERRLSPDQTRRLVADKSEFEPIRRVELPPYHYGTVFSR